MIPQVTRNVRTQHGFLCCLLTSFYGRLRVSRGLRPLTRETKRAWEKELASERGLLAHCQIYKFLTKHFKHINYAECCNIFLNCLSEAVPPHVWGKWQELASLLTSIAWKKLAQQLLRMTRSLSCRAPSWVELNLNPLKNANPHDDWPHSVLVYSSSDLCKLQNITLLIDSRTFVCRFELPPPVSSLFILSFVQVSDIVHWVDHCNICCHSHLTSA